MHFFSSFRFLPFAQVFFEHEFMQKRVTSYALWSNEGVRLSDSLVQWNHLPGCKWETGIDVFIVVETAVSSVFSGCLLSPNQYQELSSVFALTTILVHVYLHIYFCHAHLLMSISFMTDVFALILFMLLKHSIRLRCDSSFFFLLPLGAYLLLIIFYLNCPPPQDHRTSGTNL